MSTTTELLKKVAPAKARASAVAETTKPNTLVSLLRSPKVQAQMAMALPKSLTADRLTRIIITECRKTPALLNCSQESFLGSVLQCAQLGLEPGSALGHCYLLPYGKTCQLIIGYRGMIDLVKSRPSTRTAFMRQMSSITNLVCTPTLSTNLRLWPTEVPSPTSTLWRC